MRKLAGFFLLILLVPCCNGKPTPVQVKGEINFGQYFVTPPKGYWYFPRKFPATFRSPKDIFLITFWADRDAAIEKTDPNKMGVVLNFAVSKNTYKNYEAYYGGAKTMGIIYNELPNEAEMFNVISSWSCKQIGQGIYGIECISLRDNIVTIGAYGNDKGAVLSKLPLLKKMVESCIMR